ncbi:DUF7336 domain-containing protein [Serratia marcescens]|uniref:DUF7336 domain-containing protein n=1 Tax=Serratia marcescens TaxID=615 RepID=UPI001314D2D7|nr:hypothetical protein [Serratia marcescens]
MRVFILEFQDYGNFYVIGVFTSMDKAEAAKKYFLEKNEKYDDENTEITEHEVK